MLNKDFDVPVNTKVKSTRRLRFNAIIKKLRLFFYKKIKKESITLKFSPDLNVFLRNSQIPLKLKLSAKLNSETKALTIYPFITA